MNPNFYPLHSIFSVRNSFLLLACAFTFMTVSCNIINPAEPVPAYVHVDSVSFTAGALQGSSSSKINDAWVYVDGTIIGAFELPVTLPVLYAGSHKLTIRPGVLVNGIAAARTIYPFYTGYDTTVNFESEKIVIASPKVTYLSSAHLDHIEDFDQTGTNLVRVPGSDTTIIIDDTHGFEDKCGAVYLDAAHSFFAYAWKDSFPLPLGAPVYMELNYLADNEFTVGLVTYTDNNVFTDNIVTFNPGTSWRKEYVNLTPFVSGTSNAIAYKIYIKATKRSDLATTTLYFDNIKVVH